MTLTAQQRESAAANGYVLIDGILSPAECAEYLGRLDEYAHGRRAAPAGLRLQREPKVARGELAADPGDDVRKVGGMANDDLFRDLVRRPNVVEVISDLLGPNLKLFRADVLMKPARVGSAKGVHQDSPYWPIEPMDLWSCWLPFDPATAESGCMQVIPGSHRGGALPHVRVQDDYVVPDEGYSAQDLVTVPMSPGSGLFFHSLLVHGTAANTSEHHRRAITMSYLSAGYSYTGKPPTPAYLRISGVDVPGGV